MKIEFEIGKKYKNVLFGPNYVYICKFIGSTRAFLETDDVYVAIPPLKDGYEQGWREHKEPVVKTLVWYKAPPLPVSSAVEINVTTKCTSEQLEKWGYEVLKVEEISYTEGE